MRSEVRTALMSLSLASRLSVPGASNSARVGEARLHVTVEEILGRISYAKELNDTVLNFALHLLASRYPGVVIVDSLNARYEIPPPPSVQLADSKVVIFPGEHAVFFRRLADMKGDFLLSSTEKDALLDGVSEDFARKYRQVFIDGSDFYYLIPDPDLVHDREKISICAKCNAGPRSSKFSVASGHDYGRVGLVNDVARACITPTRCFGLELALSGSSGHAIAFPSNGPCELARVLPSIDEDCMPRVTFVGPLEDWQIQKKNFRSLYTIDVDAVYTWLRVLASINSVFRDEKISIDASAYPQDELRGLEAAIEATVHVTQSKTVTTVHDQAAFDEESGDYEPSNLESVAVRNSVVIQEGGDVNHGTVHEIVDALINTVDGHSSVDSQDDGAKATEATVVPIKRGRHPFVEWVDNAKILAGVFPTLFLTGSSMLPSRSLPREYVDHFIHYWDGRFEKSATFAAMLFNQMQRHPAIQKAARVGISHERAMVRFGKLASTLEFKLALQLANEHPESSDAIRMNASLLRLLSLVGGCAPFSPFERAATRPMLGAMRYRYGVAQHFVTMAPPEHDDLLLHRIAYLRESNGWNDSDKRCSFDSLPEQLKSSSEARQDVAHRYPALSAQVFERQMTSLTRDIIQCADTASNRISRNYLEQSCGVYGKVAAFNGVI